jgi:hypothetical protein
MAVAIEVFEERRVCVPNSRDFHISIMLCLFSSLQVSPLLIDLFIEGLNNLFCVILFFKIGTK